MPLRSDLKRIRGELRQQLTAGERAFLYGMVVLVVVLPPLAIGLLLFGGSGLPGVGIALLRGARGQGGAGVADPAPGRVAERRVPTRTSSGRLPLRR